MADNFIKDDININIDEAEIDLEVGIDSIDISVVANTVPPTTIPDALTTRNDYITSETMYRGDAVPGTLESEALWQIKKIITLNNGDVSILYVLGTPDYSYIWDNRLGYTYQ